jgi:23S rRNA pseudouridine1911/1915/1917 synthase
MTPVLSARMSDIKPQTHGPLHFEAGADAAGERLDRFLAAQPELVAQSISRTRVKTLIEQDRVTVAGGIVRDAAARIAAGDAVVLDLPAPVAPDPEGENIPLTVVFEDESLIVIDKPAGLVVHPAAAHETGTLVNALIAHCGDSLSGIGGVKRPGIVHRLDKNTSGLIVAAKTDAAHRGLAALFADHGRTKPFRREYRAFVWGAPNRNHGTVDAPLGRHSQHREKMAVVSPAAGRHAVTHWQVEALLPAEKPVVADLWCRLETGRTHQIRVHMAHLGHPLLGDRTYGAGYRTKSAHLDEISRAALAAMDRQALHAAVLGFPHPLTGEDLLFESPLPPDMQALRDALAASGKPAQP